VSLTVNQSTITSNRRVEQPDPRSTVVAMPLTAVPVQPVGSWAVEIGDGVTWTVISDSADDVKTKRGSTQSDGLNRKAEAGTLTVTIDNHLAQFDPSTNPAIRTGALLRASASDGVRWHTTFTGRITAIGVDYEDGNLFSTVTLTAVDLVDSMARRKLATVAAVGSGDTASARIDRLLNLGGITPSRDIVEGGTTLAGMTLGKSIWDAAGDVVVAEAGDLWVDPEGRPSFRPFAAALSLPITADFDEDNPAKLSFTSLSREFVDDTVRNEIRYSLPAGIIKTLTDTASIITETDGVPVTEENTSLPHLTQLAADDWARLRLLILARPEFRIREIELRPLTDPALPTPALTVDIGDKIKVAFTPAGSSVPVVQSCFVRGIAHAAARGVSWVTKLTLASAERFVFLTFDDESLGRLDLNGFAPNVSQTFFGGRYTAVAGALASAADLTELSAQVIARHTSSAERAAQHPIPKRGQFTFVEGVGFQFFNGTTWVRP
jgi:hypothetical protein